MEITGFNGIIGIDPGMSGAIVFWKPGKHTQVWKMPKNIADMRQIFNIIHESCDTPICFIERQALHGSDKDGKQFRIIKLLKNYEQLKTVMEMNNIAYHELSTVTWMNLLNIKCKGLERPERKKVFKEFAVKRFPDCKVTLWNCDALLILEAGRFIVKFQPEKLVKSAISNLF